MSKIFVAVILAATMSACAGEELGHIAESDAELGEEGVQLPQISSGVWYYIRARHSNRCLHQHGATLENGAPFTQWECVNEPNVQFSITPSPEPNYYYIKVRHSGKCVHQHGAVQENGGEITQWTCQDSPNVKWRIRPAGDGYYYIQAQHSGKCLHVHGAGFDNGTPITQWECVDATNVQWRLAPI